MTLPPQQIAQLFGTTSMGTPSFEIAQVRVAGPITRSVGMYGDRLVVIVADGDVGSDWDETKDFSLILGELPASFFILGGYRLLFTRPSLMGLEVPAGITLEPGERVYVFETKVGQLRAGKSGRVNEATLNRVDADGFVDTSHDDYKTNSELADILLDSIGLAHDPAPAAMNTAVDGVTTIAPPGPLDWGNASAVYELEGILDRIGWSATLKNDGSKLIVHPLARAGEEYTLPSIVLDNAEPYELQTGPGLRGQRILVTSGRTRTTIVTWRDLDDHAPHFGLEWVAFDDRKGLWMNAADWALHYPSEVAPDDLATFQAGPTGPADTQRTRDFARQFTAISVSASELDQTRQLVMPAREYVFDDGRSIGGSMAVVFARGAVESTAGQFTNVPEGVMDEQLRLDGVRAIDGEAVFVLPDDVAFVRMNPGPSGIYDDAAALTGSDLIVVFAHEANTGDPAIDYFLKGFDVDASSGTITVTEMTEPEAVAALTDPDVVKIEAEFLRRVMMWDLGDADPYPVDSGDLDDALTVVAKELALARASGALLESGEITLQGIFNVEPGITHPAIAAVSWDPDRLKTVVSIGTHEVPSSFYERQAAAARRSIAAGTGRFSLAGSSASFRDVKMASTPAGGSGNSPHAGSKSAARGVEATNRPASPVRNMAVTPGDGGKTIEQVSDIIVKIRDGATSLGSGRWSYEWDEARIEIDGTFTLAGRTSDDLGLAYNLAEMANSGAGVEGHGVDVDNLTGTFETKPIRGGRVVTLRGPFLATTNAAWIFEATNAVDGDCGGGS